MKNYIAVIGILGVLGLAVVFARPEAGSSAKAEPKLAASLLSVQDAQYDFGSISMKKGVVSRNFTITNPGDAPVTLRSISTTCMCTVAYLLDGDHRHGPFGMPGHGGKTTIREDIPAGESRTLEVVFDPAAHGPAGVGRISRGIFVEDSTGKVVTLQIQATVTP